MNHPKREEWSPYLFGEATPEARQILAEHLRSCPECAAEIAAWQRSLKRLGRWQLPDPRARPTRWTESLLKWGIAAALVLGSGFGLGRLSAPSAANLKTLRTEMEASIKSSLVSELRQQLHQEVNAVLSGFVDASATETRRQLAELIQVFNNTREEDRQAMLALVDRLQKQHAADYLALRKDLETVAALTDDEIRRTRQSFMQFTSVNTPTKP